VGEEIPAVSSLDGLDILHRSRSRPLDVLLVSAGALAGPVVRAAEALAADIGVTVVDPRWLLPVNPTLVHLASRHQLVLTVEDGERNGGVGAALAQACVDAGVHTPAHNIGLPRQFVDHGNRSAILAEHGLTAEAIAETATRALSALPTRRSTTHLERTAP
jgi:1-deoxy-D-xylulose-5-phosphate synthase